MSSKLRPLAPPSFPLVKADGTPTQVEYAFELDRLVRTLEATSGSGGVPVTRLLTAGTGLTGGGDLSADRTFGVEYGTTAGTAAQGNDARIVGAAQTADLGSAAFQPISAFDTSGTAAAAITAHDTAVATLTHKNLTDATNTFPTFNQNTTGSAAKLTTARTIDGQSFDGSANITIIAPGTHAATSKATPVDADELPLIDSAASNVLKKLTWANLKATLKTYFDTLYTPATGAWTTYTPTVTSASGTITTASASGAYQVFGKFVVFRQSITITTIGTGAGSIRATLPHSVAAQMPCNGTYINSAKSLCSQVFSNYSFSTLYDGSFPFGNGTVLSVSGFYEIA